MSSLDGQDYSSLWNPLTLDGENIIASTTTVSDAISVNNIFIEQNYLRLDSSNGPISGTLNIQGNTSISGTITTDIISANTYYGINEFNGALNNHLSVSGNSFLRENLSVNGLVYFNNNLSVSGSIISYSNLSISGSTFIRNDISVGGGSYLQTANITDGSFNNITTNRIQFYPYPTYPPNVGENITLSKKYQASEVLLIDDLWQGGTIIKTPYLSITSIINNLLSVSGTSYLRNTVVNGTLSVNTSYMNVASVGSFYGSINPGSLIVNTASINSAYTNSQYLITNTLSNENIRQGVSSLMVIRDPDDGKLCTGACNMFSDYINSVNWGGGYWLNAVAYRTSNMSSTCFNITVSFYTTSVGMRSLYVDLYFAGPLFVGTRRKDKFFNIGSNHEALTFQWTDGNSLFGNNTGYIYLYIYGGTGVITDTNDGVSWTTITMG